MQAILECKQCGGQLNPDEGQKITYCKFCGSANVISVADKFGLYNRANYLRRRNEFDRALGVYEDIIKEDPTDAEGYYGIALCKYGIEYVDDPATDKKMPTCHRTRLTLISQDEDFKKAIEYADPDSAQIYQEEAAKIDAIIKKIQNLSAKQEKYDIFICYKEGDEKNGRTNTSVLAQDIYERLLARGYKVFFARKTLENKLGSDYEPIIFSALYSAKVMLVIGTKPEEFQAVWVKNEWIRFVERISNGEECTVIPLYKDMSPYELPNELANIQALDMGKIGYVQDLLDGIGKLLRMKSLETVSMAGSAGTVIDAAEVSGLKKRAFLFLEQGDFKSADQYFERVLDHNPEDSESYWGKLLAKFECCKEEDLENVTMPISEMKSFQMAMRFGSEEQKEKYQKYSDLIDTKLYEEMKRCEEEAKQRAEQERIEAEERARQKALERALEEEKAKERHRIFLKRMRSIIIGIIFYIFIGQFVLMGVGNGIFKMLGNYKAAYNYVGLLASIPGAKEIQQIPGFEYITAFCGKQPDFAEKIKKWETDEVPSGIPCGRDNFLVSIVDDKVEFDFVNYNEKYMDNIANYLFAKQLHKIRNEGEKIKNIYSSMNRYEIFVLYENGNVKCINTYQHKHFPWAQEEDDYLYVAKNDFADYSKVEKWKDIVDIKGSDKYMYGLKKNGDIIRVETYDGFGLDDGEFSDWDSIYDGMERLYE